jgi:hypothetical protein
LARLVDKSPQAFRNGTPLFQRRFFSLAFNLTLYMDIA